MRTVLFALAILLLSCKEQPQTEIENWEARAANVEIIRDDFGVPHIYGKTDADAVFGLLYAQCEDDFNRVEQNYIWATGRLAEVEGEDALYSDLRAKLFMTKEEAKANYEKSPEWLKKLCDAFADGINYYLHTHPEVQPKLLTRFEPWMPMYFSEGSIGGDIERISTRKIKAFYEGGMELPKMELLQMEKEKEMAEPQGSNGIAIAGDLTQSGNAMLLINPHTSFYFRGEVHVVSEEGLNAYGAVTWGQFFVYQGFNEKTGWMHTSTYTDVMDEFKETMVKNNGKLFYQYGEELRPVDSTSVSLRYKDGSEIKEKRFPMYRTHHGPITHAVDGQWTASAMMWEPVKALEQSYIRTKQDGYDGFRKMMDIRTNSSNNTVYADADGNIAYFHGNFVPKRDTIFDYTRPVEGSNPKTDWQGLHTVDENILVKNPQNGWIQNCNSTPYTAALEYSPKRGDYPRYMSRDEENFRGVHAIELLTDKDGYTLDSLIQLAHDPYLPAFEVLIPDLVKTYDENVKSEEKLRRPIEIMRNWDFRTSKESIPMTLAHYYGTLVYQRMNRPKGLSSMELLNYWVKNGDYVGKLQLFSEVIDVLEADFGTWEMPWGEVNRYQRLNGDIRQNFDDAQPSIPIGFASGRWGALAAYGARYTSEGAKKLYGTRGNSFVAAVEFGDRVKAKTILAGGQSGDPNSPHFDDQIQRYANVEWKDAAYYREDVLKRAKATYRPGAR
ncbi:Penicillin amidase family protein [Croceitalea dokdonensis DOKDO 023]|uniref:Penicillin amidase family protein n=1 Tax=Croceitalea dokdonensis DOKDO 023 TaxID=1300341 RepID=A0A0P7AXI7_9FLAO|nr:acylase [Croceitalea dokdonensis]KPM32766.1 Penicillin amidase family protein [Croceitalea dokdonensis DOKDO 023]